jgi:hypothetical protein
MTKKMFGYVVVRWEDEPPAKAGGYHKISFTVLDAIEGNKPALAGSLKHYGENIPVDLIPKIGKAVIDAQYFQRTELSKTKKP